MHREQQLKPKKRRWRFRGLCANARQLGVTRNHLYKVLAGERESEGLMRRYKELKAEQRKAGATA
jgi:DNA-binding phage protein